MSNDIHGHKYPKDADGLYRLSRRDIEHIASDTLQELYPENLRTPSIIDPEDFLDQLGLVLKVNSIGSPDSGIEGCTVMVESAEIPYLDQNNREAKLVESCGTVIVSPKLYEAHMEERRRFTLLHEAGHWELHRDFFYWVSRRFESVSLEYEYQVAMRKAKFEEYKTEQEKKIPFLEWQANAYAAAILMPEAVFTAYAKEVFRSVGCGTQDTHYRVLDNQCVFRQSICRIAAAFGVSPKAAHVRLEKLGLVGIF